MIYASKKFALTTFALLLCLSFASPATAQKWVSLNDEYSIDYDSMTLKLFITHTQEIRDNTILGKAQAKIFDFISNLNTEDSDKKIKEVLAARPMLNAKIKAGISDNMKFGGASTIEDRKLYLQTYTLDLKIIKAIAPEMEFPRQPD